MSQQGTLTARATNGTWPEIQITAVPLPRTLTAEAQDCRADHFVFDFLTLLPSLKGDGRVSVASRKRCRCRCRSRRGSGRTSGGQRVQTRPRRSRACSSARGRRTRSSPLGGVGQFHPLFTWTFGQHTWRAAQAPLSLPKAPGSTGQPRALGTAAGGGQVASRLCFPGSRSRAGCLPPPSCSCPRPGRTTAPVGPCAPPPHSRLPPLSPASCQPGAGPGSPRGAAAAEQGRAGQGGGAAGRGRPRGRWRGGAGQPRPRPCGGAAPAASLPPQPRCPVPSAPAAAAHEVKMVIRVFVASSSGSVAIKKRQQDVVRFLEANRIEFEEVDITMSEEKRQWMYKNIPEDRQPAQGNPLPPQIFSDDRYCGDYDGFFESKESNTVFSFLGLKPTLASKASEP
ncbi:SH3 domain-binding glutamic acid-rich-like protein 2 [Myiozetetes cayanensis]|uniref:SH3 domain-binding glutamic acid-rich-like protein 2 n=2 Tax=Passeriformes TaxID=9126 RepID=UPI002160EEB1|nr:SH3 domain-binding glutamic acid-rich-like protein 2 [Myiozetetes cayanensis]